ncbi:hypothetical protein Taro_025570, partial [Colocasia esculenta]|nr:hypothetical protein [Colocasia esculenta]
MIPTAVQFLSRLAERRAFTSSARPGEKLSQVFWAIRRFGGVLVALSTRGRREEWGKRRAMHGLRILREGRYTSGVRVWGELCVGVGRAMCERAGARAEQCARLRGASGARLRGASDVWVWGEPCVGTGRAVCERAGAR